MVDGVLLELKWKPTFTGDWTRKISAAEEGIFRKAINIWEQGSVRLLQIARMEHFTDMTPGNLSAFSFLKLVVERTVAHTHS